MATTPTHITGTHFADGIPKAEVLFSQELNPLLERVGALSLVMRKLAEAEAELSAGALVSLGTTVETKEKLYGGMKYWTPSLDVSLLRALLKYG
jgi:hypothetical protein